MPLDSDAVHHACLLGNTVAGDKLFVKMVVRDIYARLQNGVVLDRCAVDTRERAQREGAQAKSKHYSPAGKKHEEHSAAGSSFFLRVGGSEMLSREKPQR